MWVIFPTPVENYWDKLKYPKDARYTGMKLEKAIILICEV